MATSSSTILKERDLAEITRSAEEARNFALVPVRSSHAERYLHPSAKTSYSLEYAFYLLGDIRNKIVLDLGCGQGENLTLLAEHGARVTGIDVSPDLVELAKRRLRLSGAQAEVIVGSAYQTGLPDSSVDVIFCIALVHHLDIPTVRSEMLRVLRPGGFVVFAEPTRFSGTYDWLRKQLQARENISEYEHPLTSAEFNCMVTGFEMEGLRHFRLPFVPLLERVLGRNIDLTRRASNWMLGSLPILNGFATTAVCRLRKNIPGAAE